MAHIQINDSQFHTLKDKVVVLTGGATGIGREAVKLFHQYGASIVFGDINSPLGHALESELSSSSSSHSSSSPRAKFVHCDVTSYSSQLEVFKTAMRMFGKIDVVVANAGISVPRDPFAFSNQDENGVGDGEEEIEKEFSTREIDVNLKGCLFTSRIGLFYLRKNKPAPSKSDGDVRTGGDLILVSSIAGFKESTGLATYTASKHGVLGLLRGVRVQAQREGCRVNAVCPWMTKTAMVAGIENGWRELQLPENEPSDVAKSILICATANRSLPSSSPSSSSPPSQSSSQTNHSSVTLPFSGKILFVAGGQSYEIEDRLNELEPEWLGRENSAVLERGQEFLMREGTSWDTSKGQGI